MQRAFPAQSWAVHTQSVTAVCVAGHIKPGWHVTGKAAAFVIYQTMPPSSRHVYLT